MGGDQMSAQRQYSFNRRQRIYFTTYISIRLPTYSAIKKQTPSPPPPPTIEIAAATNITHIVYTKMCLFYLICTLYPCSMEICWHTLTYSYAHTIFQPTQIMYIILMFICSVHSKVLVISPIKICFIRRHFFFIAMAKSELPLAF